jgi:hypothetical protein
MHRKKTKSLKAWELGHSVLRSRHSCFGRKIKINGNPHQRNVFIYKSLIPTSKIRLCVVLMIVHGNKELELFKFSNFYLFWASAGCPLPHT